MMSDLGTTHVIKSKLEDKAPAAAVTSEHTHLLHGALRPSVEFAGVSLKVENGRLRLELKVGDNATQVHLDNDSEKIGSGNRFAVLDLDKPVTVTWQEQGHKKTLTVTLKEQRATTEEDVKEFKDSSRMEQAGKQGGLEQKLNVDLLKEIHDKCVKKYNDKYVGALFDVNVTLINSEVYGESEVYEVEKLVSLAKISLAKLTQDPRFKELEKLVKEGEDKGYLLSLTPGAPNWLIEDPKAKEAYKTRLPGGGQAIAAPTDMRNLWLWKSKVNGLESILNLYEKGGARGMSAKYFGEDVYAVYKFVKETYTIIEDLERSTGHKVHIPF